MAKDSRLTLKKLLERIENLENQVFAQKLVIDELELKVNPPPTDPLTAASKLGKSCTTQLTPYASIMNHTWPLTPDANGEYHCVNCNQMLGRAHTHTWTSSGTALLGK